jgi:adenosylhomocysteine nucleosidase
MRILVTFAVEAEFAPWRRMRRFLKTSKANSVCPEANSSFQAELAAHQVEVVLTGIGKASCELIFNNDHFPAAVQPEVVISCGLAGGLKDSLQPGDLVVAKKSRTLRNDANVDVDVDPTLLERASAAGATAIETLVTVDRIVPTAEEKARLAFFGEAVDMESALILAHFAKLGIPALAVRAISDAANEDLPLDFDRCLTPKGAIKPINLMNQIVRRPGNLANLVRFGRQSKQAAQKLAKFLDNFLATMPVDVAGAVKA